MIALSSVAPAADWRDLAECRGIDPGIFHPADEEENEFSAEPAKAICVECPVREACLEHAITVREKHGVWGGLTARERRRLIRRRRRAS